MPTSAITPRVIRRGSLDWVKFDVELARDGSVDPVDKALYAALATFVDRDGRDTDPDPDGEDVPTRTRLARCIGRSVDTVDRATKRLEAKGLLRVERRRDPDNAKRHLPSVYELLDHEWWDERASARAAARAEARRAARVEAQDDGGGRTAAARGSRTGAARGGRTDAARGSRMGAADVFKNPDSENPDPDARVRARETGDRDDTDGRTDLAPLTDGPSGPDVELIEVGSEPLAVASAIVARLDLARLDARPGQVAQITQAVAEVLSRPGMDAAQVERYTVAKVAEARTVKYLLGALAPSRLVDLLAFRAAASAELAEPEPCRQHPGASRRGDGECAGCFADRAAVDARAEVG
jgi:hypothetical protein